MARTTIFRAVLLTIVLIVASVAATAEPAVIPGAAFEGADGDLTTGTLPDWEAFVGTSALKIGYDEPTGQDDDSLRGKEDDLVPTFDTGSIPNNKSDLQRFYVIHQSLEIAGETRDFLYLAWTRANTLGTANMDFEFNQADGMTENAATTLRTPGDMLILFGFANGGNTVDLGLSRWTETGPCEASNSAPCWGPVMPLAGIAEGAVNFAATLDPVTGETLPELTFGEAIIDLTAAGVFDRESCMSFGGAYVKSRSSDSFTSSMKDFIKPIDVSVSNCATVRVVKNAVPDGATTFSFTASSSLNGPTAFDLVDDGSGSGDSADFETPEGGAGVIAEQPTAGWDLTDVQCSGPAVVESANGAPTGRVDLDLTAGNDIECTYTNVARGRLIVDEVTIPAADPQTFGYATSGPGGPLATFALADASPAHDSGLVVPGSYAISTDPLPAGWDLTSVVCSDGSAPGSVDIAPGETVTCTFTHTKRGRVVVDKATLPAGDTTSFDFSLTGGPDAIADPFSLADATPARASAYLRPGTYAVAEADAGADWDLTSATCSDGSDPAAIDLAPGETVTCTFTNTRRGRIVVDKVTLPADDPTAFSFSVTGDGFSDPFMLADGDDPRGTAPLVPGTYAVGESDAGDAWDLTSATCSDGSDPASIDLAPGETVTCTFTNTKRGRIAIDKVTLPAADPTAFDFTLSDGGGAVLATPSLADADAPATSAWLAPGTYAVAEADAGAEWDLTGVSCSDGSDASAIDLGAGETVTCTFTNTKRGRIVVDKTTLPAGDPTSFDFSLTGGPDAVADPFSLADATPARASSYLRPGTYAVAESDAGAEWDLTSASCSDGSDPAEIDLAAGETVTCTFNNTKRGHIVVDKVTLPAGDPASFGFTLVDGAAAPVAGFSLTDAAAAWDSGALVPGAYSLSEDDAGAEWDLTDVSCSDGSDPAAIDLAPGETVTCTFTNTKRGRIVVDKKTLPAGHTRKFAFTIDGIELELAFSLADADDPLRTPPIRPGTYAVAEGALDASWDLASATCSDGSSPDAVEVDPGETVTCTFTNVERASLTVIKDAAPAEGDLFSFSATGSDDSHSFVLADGGMAMAESSHLMLLRHGTWVVAEGDAGEAWDLVRISCSDDGNRQRGSVDLGAGTVSLDLVPGDDVTCTFNNRKRGKIVVNKYVVNESLSGVGFDPRTAPFDFTAEFTDPFQLAHGDSLESDWLEPERRYGVSERLPRGWVVESSCVLPDGGLVSGGASIDVPVAPGAVVECTFVNEMRIHPGTHGFWRNWRNHYVESQLLWVLAELADSPVTAPWFDDDGNPTPEAVDGLDYLYEEAEHPPAFRAVREYVTLLLDIAVSTSDDPAVRALQMNDDVCESCILDLDDRPGAEDLIRSLAPCVRDDVTVGDVLTAVELEWTGDLGIPAESFDGLTESQILLLHAILDDINNGRNVVVDPETYPDDPGCLEHPDGPTVWREVWRDADGDGFGDAGDPRYECSLDEVDGWSDTVGDCDDTNADSYPGAVEICDLQDNDCDGIVDTTADADLDGVNDVCDAFPTDAELSGPLHVGVIDGVDDVWRTIALPGVYQDPIVVVGPASGRDAEPGVLRVDRVTNETFDLRFEEWSYLDGVHGEESVAYLVLERGRHTMDDGSVWEAGTFPLAGTGVGSGVPFEAPFAGVPTVLLTLQTANDPVPVTAAARDLTGSGFAAALYEEGWLMRERDPASLLDSQVSTSGGELAALAGGPAADESTGARQHGEELVGYVAVHSAGQSGYAATANGPLAYLRQRLTLDERGAPLAGWKLRAEPDGTVAGGPAVSDEVNVLAVEGAMFAQKIGGSDERTTVLRRSDPTDEAPVEWGTVDGVSRTWTVVPLAGDYVDPVVIVKSTSMNGGNPVVARTRNVAPGSFEVTLRDWEYLEPIDSPERVFFMVAERGRHNLGGLDIEAGTFDLYAVSQMAWEAGMVESGTGTQPVWADVEFATAFADPPAVYTYAQTFVGADPVVTRVHDRSVAGFRSLLQEEEGGDGGHMAETIGWIAIEAGSGTTADGRTLSVSVDAIGDAPRLFSFDPMATGLLTVVADLASTFEMDPCTVRHTTVDDRSVELLVEEEQSADDEMEHTMEDLSLFVAD